jgi:polyisoprenoid-binding protein YceI
VALGAALLGLEGTGAAAPADAPYVVVESKSSVRVHVGKAGLLSFAGHLHEVLAPVAGTVTADAANLGASRVDLTFASARLTVLAAGAPEGEPPKVEEVMRGPAVLDVVRFPEIRFHSTMVTGRGVSASSYELRVTGELSLHGVAKEIAVPVKVEVEGRALIATGQLTLRHDQFGMKPVTAGGGAVKVANEIKIDFRIVAER